MRAKLTIINYRNRLIDIDNISCKSAIDGLVHAGVLPDDSPEHVAEVTIKQVKAKVERTIITVVWEEDRSE